MVAAGGLVSLALGILLASISLFVFICFEGLPKHGEYCSEFGIGRYEAETPAREVVYLDDGWSGFPPRQHCRVYLLDSVWGDGQPTSAEEMVLRAPLPHRLLADGTYPGTKEYAWVVGLLLLPVAIWGLLILAWVARHRMVARHLEAPDRHSGLR